MQIGCSKKLPRMFRCCINSKNFCLLWHCLEHINPLCSQFISTVSTETVDLNYFFKKRKFESTLNLRSKYQIPLVRELHVYERFKLLEAVSRQPHTHPENNSYISPKEIYTIFNPEEKNKFLKTENRLKKQNKNYIKVRVRIL